MSGTSEKRKAERARRLVELGPMPPWWRVFARRRWQRRHNAIMAMAVSLFGEMLASLYGARDAERLADRPAPAFNRIKKDDRP